MIYLQNADDLKRILKSPRLYSREPVTLLMPVLNQGIAASYESRINLWKKNDGWLPSIKNMLVTLVVVLGINMHNAVLSSFVFVHQLPFVISITLIAGIVDKTGRRIYARLIIRKQIRKLLKCLHQFDEVMHEHWLTD